MEHATPQLLHGHQQSRLTAQHADPTRSSNIVDIPDPDPNNQNVGAVISRLEDIITSVQESVWSGQEPSIPYRARPRNNGNGNGNGVGNTARRRNQSDVVRFPGRTDAEAIKFTQLLLILKLSLSAIISGNVITMRSVRFLIRGLSGLRMLRAREHRNIFYQNKDLFAGRQSTVDGLVDDLAFTLNIGRHDLQIAAAPKGLVAGPIRLYTKSLPGIDIDIIDASSGDTGVNIPHPKAICQIDFGTSEWVLVIEKEATFRTLATSRYWDTSTSGRGILVTGKGYPDLRTRQFLHMIHTAMPELPVFALVDYDPHGVEIMRCYRDGSRAQAHETGVVVPGLQWLGITSDDLNGGRLHQSNEGATGRRGNFHHHFSPYRGSRRGRTPRSNLESFSFLSIRDKRKASILLRDTDEDGDGFTRECRRELQVMMFLGIKAEIQAVDNSGDMSDWLDEHMTRD